MPLYRVGCDVCGHEEDIFRSLSQYDDLPECCGVSMHRMVCAPAVVADIQPYKSMLTGEMITSRSHHRAHLKQHGCIEVGNEKMEPRKELPKDPRIKQRIVEAMYQTGVKKA